MKKICAGCGKDMGTLPGDSGAKEMVSHGLCKPCSIHFLADVGISLGEFIEGLDAPVVAVSPDGLIADANAAAQEMLGKDIGDISGKLGGDVFECEFALLPEGCGRTVHCSGCAIRRTVMETIRTGKAQTDVPAFLNHHEPDGVEKTALLISTQTKGGVVFLSVKFLEDKTSD